MTPEENHQAEELRRALAARAADVEPGPDAYARLEARIAGEPTTPIVVLENRERANESRRGGRPSLPPRILAAAAALLLVIGGGAFLAGQNAPSDTVTADGGTTIAPAAEEDEPPPPIEHDDSSASVVMEAAPLNDAGEEPLDEEIPVEPELPPAPSNFVFGPVRSTRLEAATAFMDLVRRSDVVVEIDEARAFVTAVDEGEGVEIEVTTLELASRPMDNGEPGYTVISASTGAAVIDEPAPQMRLTSDDGLTDEGLTVAGTGHGFEGGLNIEVFASEDGVLLHRRPAMAGNFGESAPFSTTVPVAGDEFVWVVVESTGGLDAVAPFSAVAVQYDAPLPSISYVVSGIEIDDPDGGLLLRRAPLDGSAAGNIVEAAIPAGTGGIVRRGDAASPVRANEWWNVELPDGATGWVNSRYLTREGNVSEDSLAALADEFSAALVSNDPEAFAALPWATNKPVRVGWSGGLVNASASELASAQFWDTTRIWTIPAEFEDGTSTETPRSFLSPTPAGQTSVAEMQFEYPESFDDVSPYGSIDVGGERAVFGSEFAGSTAVLIRHPNDNEGSGWQHTAVFVERTPSGGAQIVGVVIVFWIP